MKSKLLVVLLALIAIFSFAQAETCSHENIDYNVLIDETTHGDICSDCGEVLWTAEHSALCTTTGVCWCCGYESADIESNTHNYEYRNNSEGKCEEYCLDCGEILYAYEHAAKCTEPGVCSSCGYESADMEINSHAAYAYRNNSEGKCEEYCLDCGEIPYAYEHFASCTEPGVCGRCGYESADMEINSHAYAHHNNSEGQCEYYCLDCGEIFDTYEHAAKCTEPGVCSSCGYESADIEIVSHYHTYRNNSENKCEEYCPDCGEILNVYDHVADCPTPGVCISCGYESADIEAAWHNYAYHNNSDGKCEYYCRDCGAVIWTTEHAASCTEPGVCGRCGYESADIHVNSHDYAYRNNSEGQCEEHCLDCGEILCAYEHAAECTEPGVCWRCGYESADMEINSHAYAHHNNSEGQCEYYCLDCGEIFDVRMHAAECTEPGVCWRCGYESADIQINSHAAYAYRNNSEGKCEEYCLDCGEILDVYDHIADCPTLGVCISCGYESADIEAAWHNYAYRNNSDGKCEDYCLDCGEVIWTGEHAASCTEPGVCDSCGYESADMEIRWHDSEYRNNSNGKCEEYCLDCGEILDTHEHGADCTAPGVCWRCGYELSDDIGTTHAYEYRNNSDGQCEEYCTACGEILETYKHEASCTEPGVCWRCGYESADMEIGRHDYEYRNNSDGMCEKCCLGCDEIFDTNIHEASCTEPGVCWRCGYVSDIMEPVHSGSWHTTSAGECEQYCSDCGETFGIYKHLADCDEPTVCQRCGYESADVEVVHYSDCYSQGACVRCGNAGEDGSFSHISYSGYDLTPNDGATHTLSCKGCTFAETYEHTPLETNPSVCYNCGGKIYTQPADSRESTYAPVYDYDYYLSNNPDLAAAFGSDRTAAMDHFIDFGMDEGRPSSAEFSWTIYRANYPELEAVFGNTPRSYYEHYIAYGKAEGRVANQLIAPETPEQPADSRESAYAAVYNYDYYTGKYPDVVAAFNGDRTATLDQFINYGMAEGRQGNSSFNVDCYRANYPDLQAVFGSNLKAYYNHYIDYGKAEGRVANQRITPEQPSAPETDPNAPDSRESYYAPVYDFDYYVGHYADVAAAFGGDRTATLDQFINYGMSEGRQGSAEFNVKTYRANYPDLEAVFGGDLKAYYKHYINYGKSEGRSGR